MGSLLDQETREPPQAASTPKDRAVIALTVVHHPDLTRVGQKALLQELRPQPLSRLSPLFSTDGTPTDAEPLADPFLSRKAVDIECTRDGGVRVTNPQNIAILVDGQSVVGDTAISADGVNGGVVLELNGRVVLVLHRTSLDFLAADDMGLMGNGEAINTIRNDILRVAESDLPVMIRGETGSGKELIASAIHKHSPRKEAPYIAVNMAAIPPSVAGSELFGHKQGAFTGADKDRDGLFVRADGGTLFLDEIGEMPVEVQVMLLRTLETQRVTPLGASKEQTVNVRLVSATDRDLSTAVRTKDFRPALFHRLAGYEIHVPPLCARREDIGSLVHHFFQPNGSKTKPDEAPAKPKEDPPKLFASVMARLARYTWPGNVRQLRNVCQQLSIVHDEPEDKLHERLAQLLHTDPEPPSTPTTERPVAPPQKPRDIEPDRVFETMRNHQWRLEPAARALGVSRASLYRLIRAHPRLRTAKDLSIQELQQCHASMKGDLDKMSEALLVSKSGIRLRLRELNKQP